MQKIIVLGKFPGINEYTDACRTNRFAGGKMKKSAQAQIQWFIRQAKIKPTDKMIRIKYHFYESNKKRDLDNVSGFFHKVFQDALVENQIITNDGWKNIKGFSDEFDVDKENPRIEIEIEEL